MPDKFLLIILDYFLSINPDENFDQRCLSQTELAGMKQIKQVAGFQADASNIKLIFIKFPANYPTP